MLHLHQCRNINYIVDLSWRTTSIWSSSQESVLSMMHRQHSGTLWFWLTINRIFYLLERIDALGSFYCPSSTRRERQMSFPTPDQKAICLLLHHNGTPKSGRFRALYETHEWRVCHVLLVGCSNGSKYVTLHASFCVRFSSSKLSGNIQYSIKLVEEKSRKHASSKSCQWLQWARNLARRWSLSVSSCNTNACQELQWISTCRWICIRVIT